MERTYTIYGYFNPIENKWYVGRTYMTQKGRSKKEGSGYRNQGVFWSAIQRYGWDLFNHNYHILETTTDLEESYELEKKWVEKKNSIYPNGYNLEGGGTKGKIISQELRNIISQANMGHPGNPGSGRPGRKIQQFTMDGQFVAEYNSSVEVFKKTGIRHSWECCMGQAKSAGGSIWRFSP